MLQPPQRHGALAARAAARRKAHGTPLLVPHPEDRYQPFPLSDMQQAYWIGRSGDLQGGGVAMQSCVELDCPALFPDRFEKALNALVARHDMLHAVVTEDGRQRVLPLPVHFPLTISDLSDLDPAEQEQRLAEYAACQAQKVSDLGTWPQSEVHFFLLGHNADGSKRGVLHFRWDMWATDGRSFQILYEDLAALYLDPDAKLPPLPVTFRDCVLALQELENSDAYQKSLAYWRKELAHLPAAPIFPTPPAAGPGEQAEQSDHEQDARYRQDDSGTKRYADVLTREETAVLEQECRTRGLSLTAVLASLYSEVVGLWSATRSFTLNMPRFNRNLHWHEALNHVMGEFATFTLVPVDLEAGSNLAERAQVLQKTLWSALEHGDVSGVRLLRELARLRGELAAEAMPVVFTAMPARKGSDRGVEQVLRAFGSVRATHGSTPQTTLDCQYTLFNDCLHIYWDARTKAFPSGMTDAMFSEFMRVVRLAASDMAAWSAPALAAVPADQMAVRKERNARPLALPDKMPCQLFVERALEDPDAPALVDGDLTLSYGALLGHALTVRTGLLARLARQESGERQEHLRPGSRSVALVLERGWQAIACIMGIQLAGLPYLPLDCANPGERLHGMLRAGGAALVLADAAGRAKLCTDTLAADGIGLVAAEDLCGSPGAAGLAREELAREELTTRLAQDLAATAPGPEDAAYIILTSGTTGTPKAVVVGQQGLLNVCTGTNSLLGLGRGDRVLGVTALHHDLSVYDVFGTLTGGACLVLLPHEQAQDPDVWTECILRHKVTLWNSVPAFLKALATRCEERRVRLPLRVVLTGGDWVETGLPRRLSALAPGCAFYSVGGPTETTVWNIMYRVEEKLPAGWSVIPYGAATENNSYYLLDSQLREVPDWVTGEMYCAGVNVCLDIRARDDVQRFFVHPGTGERLYRTGDMGRFHPDGLIEITGRADFQINIGGYRLDPAEIETALQRHRAVERAVVVPVGQGLGSSGRVLGAFILPRGTGSGAGRPARQVHQASQAEQALEEELTRFLEERLPAQMIPRVWRLVADLPLTANGKVDRKALVKAAESLVAPRAEDADRQPETPLERLLCSLWEEVLGCPVPGARTNFFRLGGDSLKAVQILTRLKEQLPLSLPLQAFFATPTIEGLAGTLIDRISARMHKQQQENA